MYDVIAGLHTVQARIPTHREAHHIAHEAHIRNNRNRPQIVHSGSQLPLTIMDLLNGIIELIEMGWTRGKYARNKRSEPVIPTSNRACKWCLMGTLPVVSEYVANSPIDDFQMRHEIHKLLMEQLNPAHVGVIAFNDQVAKSKTDVINLVKQLQERLRTQPGSGPSPKK